MAYDRNATRPEFLGPACLRPIEPSLAALGRKPCVAAVTGIQFSKFIDPVTDELCCIASCNPIPFRGNGTRPQVLVSRNQAQAPLRLALGLLQYGVVDAEYKLL